MKAKERNLKIRSQTKVILLSAIALAAVGFAAVGVSNATQPPAPANAESVASSPGANGGKFPKNAAGETYGSLADADSEEDAPDLVLVELANGKDGYIRSKDLFAAENAKPASPEEAVKLQARNAEAGPESIPAYAADGKTNIGTWEGVQPDSVNEG